MLVRVVDGALAPKDKILLMSTQADLPVRAGGRVHAEVGADGLRSRRARWASSSPASRNSKSAQVGDTITLRQPAGRAPLPGFKEIKPQVFAGLYPVEANEYDALRDALEKLHLNDSSLRFEPETSQALGFGFRCGFLGLLHLEIVQERLEREYDMDLITTAPTVVYQVQMHDGTRGRGRESLAPARCVQDRGDPRADHHRHHPGAERLRRPGHDPVHRQARRRRRTCSTWAARSC